MPRVTIHIPTYNQAQFIAYALEGALNQTYDDYDVIVSDNHCTDGTDAVLARYADHPRLTIIKPPEHLTGIPHFRFCVAQSDSEYFSYLCSDDVMLPEFLEQQVALLDRYPNASFVHSAAQRIDEEGRPTQVEKSIKKTHVTPGPQALIANIGGSKSVCVTCLFRRDRFDQVGGFGDLYVNDWEITFKLCAVGDVVYNQNILMQYRDWSGNSDSMRKRLAHIEGVGQFYATYAPKFPEHAARFRAARLTRALGFVDMLVDIEGPDADRARELILEISDDPRVHAKIRAFELGLGPAFVAARRAKQQGKRWLKSKLYPLLAPSHTNG